MSMDTMECGCLSHADLEKDNPCKYPAAAARVKELEAQLAQLQGMPELPWAQVTASLMQRFARLSRDGDPKEARLLMDVLDRGSTYVNRLEARAQRAAIVVREACASLAEDYVEDANLCGTSCRDEVSAVGESIRTGVDVDAIVKAVRP